MTNKTTRALHLADAAVALAKVSTARADDIKLYDEALTVIREALAEQDHFAASGKPIAEPVKQEPVAYTYKDEVILAKHWTADYPPSGWTPLYAAPVDAKAIRAEALEEAAKVCQRYHDKLEELGEDDYQTGRGRGAIDCAAAIRSLK